MRILLVEDNVHLVVSLSQGFREQGLETESTRRGTDALAAMARGVIDVVILDLGLPDLDGMEVISRARASGSRCPLLVLTARDAVAARVAALEAGADDFVTKPFAFAELVARVRALARRATGPRWAPLTAGGVVLDDDLAVRTADRQVTVSPRQYTFLAYLLRRRGEVVSRPEILKEVFGYAFDPGTNIVDVHLAHLRRKLTGFPIEIETIRGAGFRLQLVAP